MEEETHLSLFHFSILIEFVVSRNKTFSWADTLPVRPEWHLREMYLKREFHLLPQVNQSVCVCVCVCVCTFYPVCVCSQKCPHRLKRRSERNKNLSVGASNKPSVSCLITGYFPGGPVVRTPHSHC